MPIPIVCPGCHSRFNVSDKFAGKTGPCPKCKTVIAIPEKTEEVKVHGHTEFAEGGRGVDGRLVTKPVARTDAKWDPLLAMKVAAAAVLTVAVTWAGGGYLAVQLTVLLLVSPPLVIAMYTVLRNAELEPYRGRALYLRAGACGVIYAILWVAWQWQVTPHVTEELWMWAFFVTPFIIVGALTALASLDLDFGTGSILYSGYLLATVFLRWVAGMGWVWVVD